MADAAASRRRRREPLRAQRERSGDIDLRSSDRIDLTTGSTPRRRILIVEDEPDVFGWLRAALEPLRWDVNGARTARDALEMAARLLPDVVVLDQMLPDGTGIEVGRWLRANQPAMSLVMFSAHIDPATEAEATRLGIATISKLDAAALLTTLRSLRDDLDAGAAPRSLFA